VKIFDLRSFALAQSALGLPQAGLRILLRAHMDCSISSVGSGRLGGFFETGTLVKNTFSGVLQDISVNPIIDLKFGGSNPLSTSTTA
jgi:hypothetical protein